MSIDLDWETLTSGPDGEALSNSIKTFIHDKFQAVPLPRFIKSVNVHGFDLGTVAPDLELKDITDPLPDFYEEEVDEEEEDSDDDGDAGTVAGHHASGAESGAARDRKHHRRAAGGLRAELLRGEFGSHDLGPPFLGTSTPGILGGPGLNYFQSHLGGGTGGGTHTPLAHVAGAQAHHFAHHHHHHHNNNSISPWGAAVSEDLDAYALSPSHSRNPSQSSMSVEALHPMAAAAAASSAGGTDLQRRLREKNSVSTMAGTSSIGTSRPPTRDTQFGESAIVEDDDNDNFSAGGTAAAAAANEERRRREPRVEDVQAVFRIRYAGDVRLNLTAEILLDYPMPSFVGIPLKLNITGLSFDGVGVLANIRKRLHFCFLSPEDAVTAVGPDEGDAAAGEEKGKEGVKFGGLLQEIKVESEIGERHGGKQSLKNVGKVERFVLDQVRRIFEEEFVYPSFWTFLV